MTSAREIGVGVIGLGLMGRVHVEAYARAAQTGLACRLVAVSDRDVARLSGRSQAGGNLQSGGETVLFDSAHVRASVDPEVVLSDPGVDLVSICTPTDTHVELALRALAAGKHVLVEKPVSLDPSAIERLDIAAQRAGRICMPAMCMRFWPGWSWLKRATVSGEYGRVISASFQRLSARPAWGQDFYADPSRSGGALFDLHVHDVDFVHWLFGTPDSVASSGTLDHVTTLYRFARGPAHVTAEGAWDPAAGFPFRMRYVVVFERATAEFDLRRDPPLEISRDGRVEARTIDAGTGYEHEIRALLEAVSADSSLDLPTISEAAAVARILLAEKTALARGI